MSPSDPRSSDEDPNKPDWGKAKEDKDDLPAAGTDLMAAAAAAAAAAAEEDPPARIRCRGKKDKDIVKTYTARKEPPGGWTKDKSQTTCPYWRQGNANM